MRLNHGLGIRVVPAHIRIPPFRATRCSPRDTSVRGHDHGDDRQSCHEPRAHSLAPYTQLPLRHGLSIYMVFMSCV